MASRKEQRRKKTRPEVKYYKNTLGQNEVGMSGTYDTGDSLLTGSDKFRSGYRAQENSDEPIKAKPWTLVVRDWLKQNWVPVLITAILIPFFIWIAKEAIEIRQEQAVYQYRLEKVDEKLSEVSDSIPDKNVLELRLNELKEDIGQVDVVSLNSRLSVLEQEIENIKQSQETAK